MPKVLVTGASGFVARHLRMALSRDGFDIVSASRGSVEPLPGETTHAISGYDDPAIYDAARGCIAAMHLVGSGRQTVRQSYGSANHTPAAAIARVCRMVQIPRMVYLSGLGVSADAPTGYFISKYLAERAVTSSVAEPVIFRPSYIIGPDDHLTANLRRQESTGTILVPGSGDYPMQPISVHDVVRILEMAATAGRFAGRTLDMVGPQTVTFAEYVRKFAGSRSKIEHADMERVYRDAVLNRGPTYELDDLNIMIGGYIGDHDALRRMTRMRFRTIPDMLQPGGPA